MPGTRKKRVSKYWRSSTESGFTRSPFTVRIQVERKRVSKEERPVGSVDEASMSRRESLTTNVLPSRIWTRPSLIAQSLEFEPVDRQKQTAVRARFARPPSGVAKSTP